MPTIKNFGETQDVSITILVDNWTSMMRKSTNVVKYYTEKPLQAEHGFSALIDLKETGKKILWDAGITHNTLLNNAKQMGIELAKIDKIALSHGHSDHTAAITEVVKIIDVKPKPREWKGESEITKMLNWFGERRVPIIAHPSAIRERWELNKDGSMYGPAIVPWKDWEISGAELIFSEGPYQLDKGCWTTGVIPRLSFEKLDRPSSRIFSEGDKFFKDEVDDDQTLIINIKNKGLVVITGCAHSGIVNIVNYAKEISGVDKVWGVIGGFHLANVTDEDLSNTITAFKQLRPAIVAPSHCTGFEAISRFSAEMTKEFVLSLVGTTFLF